ncbi:MAG: ergothioneine biosynthesis protein EgtB [Enterobacterales bacterium]|jgi:ergothioneine biosynthesis protein EgtB
MIRKYLKVREDTEQICIGLSEQELSNQPRTEVSPAKWHLGHTTWFFEKIILEKHSENYQCFKNDYDFVFNSYYKQIGKHVNQSDRGEIDIESSDILDYRKYVDEMMIALLDSIQDSSQDSSQDREIKSLLQIGLNHEQQHQELLHMDIKSVFFSLNKNYPLAIKQQDNSNEGWLSIPEGLNECGLNEGENSDEDFCFDNEQPLHKHYQYSTKISHSLVTNAQYSEFITSGGYSNPKYWLSKGWDWVEHNTITHPLYWNDSLASESPVAHISYFEADAYANWIGCRLPTEFEHEYFDQFTKTPSVLWSWTSSQYSPYPGFQKFNGALSEYSGKFMCNQFVLRGGCIATPQGHWRPSYRNFYEPHQRWLYSGIRLAKDDNQ